MRPALPNEYQNPEWNRKIANRWAGVAGILAATLLAGAVFATRHLEIGPKGLVLGALLTACSFAVGEIHRRYNAVKVWTEGGELVIRNAFSLHRLPVADLQRGVWHTNRSGGMPLSVIKVRLAGRVQEIRVLALPPLEAGGYVDRLVTEGTS